MGSSSTVRVLCVLAGPGSANTALACSTVPPLKRGFPSKGPDRKPFDGLEDRTKVYVSTTVTALSMDRIDWRAAREKQSPNERIKKGFRLFERWTEDVRT